MRAKSKGPAKRKPGRPLAGLNRRPRNVQMTDAAYARLVQLGNGRAADGIERLDRHGLTVSQRDGLLKLGHCSVITVAQLKAALLS